ncbi:MAG: restriction endonuclease [Leptolyngbyaceae cyanobacterium]
MPTAADYQAEIENYDRAELLQFWQSIQDRNTLDWPPGKAFEYFILRAFQLEDAIVTYPYGVQLSDMTSQYTLINTNQTVEQIDGVVYCDGLTCLVEAKDQAEPLNVEPIAKMRNQLLRRHASTIGVVFSRSGFTPPASILAQYLSPQMVLLWDGSEITYALEQGLMRQSLVKKYRVCIEKGKPDYDPRPEEAKTL